MPSGFNAALDAEISELEAEIRNDPRVAKLEELKRLRDRFYRDATKLSDAPERPFSERIRPGLEEIAARGRRASPERERILKEATTLISGEDGVPVPTIEIFRKLQELSIAVSGDNPVNNLSAMLSNSGRFVANGRSGWTIRPILDQSPDHVAYPDDQTSDPENEGEVDPDEQRHDAGFLE